jgi:endonuclease-3
MDKEIFQERKERANKIGKELKELYPNPPGTALNYSNRWELTVAVILSAQCTDEQVNEVTADLFEKYETLDDYVEADKQEFQQDIYSTGFYKNKTKHVLGAAQKIKDDFDGAVPQTMSELTELPGVGRKTANVILGNAFDTTKGFVVDTHVRRFAIKFDLTDYERAKKIEEDLMRLFPKEEWFVTSNRLILYGREICPAREHECEDHPLTKIYPPAANTWPKSA